MRGKRFSTKSSGLASCRDRRVPASACISRRWRDDDVADAILALRYNAHEAPRIDVAKDSAFAAERFGEKESAARPYGQRRWDEIATNFHVRERSAGVIGDSHAIAGGDIRIGRLAIDLRRGRQWPAAPASARSSWSAAIKFVDEKRRPTDRPGFHDELGCERVRAQMQ